VVVTDIVHAQKLLLEHLGVKKLAGVIGGSFGGMQVIEWGIRYPEFVERCICIAAGASLSAQALAFDLVARDAILSDPNWAGGDYYEREKKPSWGLSHARKIGHITYLSPEIMQERFGREKIGDEGETNRRYRFQVESYLDHQGKKLVDRFDANSYLTITQAMDSYDLVKEYGSLEEAFKNVRSKFLVIALSSDWLFPPEQSVEIANALLRTNKQVSCCTLEAPYGHDAFLLDIEHLPDIINAFLPWVENREKESVVRSRRRRDKIQACPAIGGESGDRGREFEIISNIIKPGKTVLDLGCGAGDLLTMLVKERNISGIGVDIDVNHVIEVIDKGHDIFQGDIDAGLAMIPDNTYDYAILSETLQIVRKPRFVLNEMLRVAKEGIVSFPNIGRLHHRLRIGFSGKMPKDASLPFEWYDTPNIHLFTLRDFVELCFKENIKIQDLVSIPEGVISRFLVSLGLCNLGADRVLVRITR
ncbi:homoserine O-acetyltransferase, partial [Verrucomicrobiota bacterium]